MDLADHALTLVRSSSGSDAGDRARRLLAAAWPHSTPEVRGALSAAEAQVALHDGLLGDATTIAQAALDGFPGGPGRVALARVVQNVRLLTEETVSASLALDTLDLADPGEQQAAEAFAVETALMLLAVGRPTAAQTVAERLVDLRSTFSETLQAELDYVLARTGSGTEDEHPDDALRRWSRARARAEVDRPDVSGRTPWEAAGLHLYALRHASRISEARRVLAALSGTPCSRYDRMLFDLNHAMVEYSRGNYVLAQHHVERMSELADLGSCATSLRVTIGLGSSLHGEPHPAVDELLRTTRDFRGTTLGPTLLDVRAEITRGVVSLVSGQTDQALDLLEHARSSMFLDEDERSALADTMVTVVLPVALARAYVAEGRTSDAATLSTRVRPGDGRSAWMSSAARDLVDAVARTPWQAEVPVTPALVRWLTDPRLVQPVRDHLRHLLAAQPTAPVPISSPRSEPRGEAQPGWSAARPDQGGAPYDRTPVPADVRSVLSDRELQIALLVARGMRNKEISATVFLSVRTVEATLTRVFRKVDVRSRTELVSRLGGSTAVLSGDVAR